MIAAWDQGAVVRRVMFMDFTFAMIVTVTTGGEEQTDGEREERSDYLFCFHGYEVGVKFWATSER